MKQILGYGDDEGYNVYSEPWRKESNLASNIYRPGKNIDKEAYGGQEDLDELRKTNRYVPSLIATISTNFAKPTCFHL